MDQIYIFTIDNYGYQDIKLYENEDTNLYKNYYKFIFVNDNTIKIIKEMNTNNIMTWLYDYVENILIRDNKNKIDFSKDILNQIYEISKVNNYDVDIYYLDKWININNFMNLYNIEYINKIK